MTKIRFDYGTVTISDGVIQAPSPTLAALLDALAATLPGYGSIPFILDQEVRQSDGLVPWRAVGRLVDRRSCLVVSYYGNVTFALLEQVEVPASHTQYM